MRQEDAVIDWDIELDDARQTITAAVERVRSAVRERRRAVAHLAHLRAMRAVFTTERCA